MSDIKNFDIRTQIIDAILDVFDTVVSMEVEFSDSAGSVYILSGVRRTGFLEDEHE